MGVLAVITAIAGFMAHMGLTDYFAWLPYDTRFEHLIRHITMAEVAFVFGAQCAAGALLYRSARRQEPGFLWSAGVVVVYTLAFSLLRPLELAMGQWVHRIMADRLGMTTYVFLPISGLLSGFVGCVLGMALLRKARPFT